MSAQNKLVRLFDTTHWLATKFADGLSHEDSLALPAFKTNSFNWVLGHILVGRDRVLHLLGYPTVLSAESTELYETGSNPVDDSTAVPLPTLLEALSASQTALAESLQSAADEDLAKMFDEERGQSVRDRIEGLHWHETYHIGQLEILRQVSAERESFP